MKKKLLLFVATIAIIGFTQKADARIWRVNKISDYVLNNAAHYGGNVGGTFTKPVFAELSNVMVNNSVSNGDTIHLEGCAAGAYYTSTTITKKLIIIGAGFFLDENPKVSNNTLASKVSGITFDATSAGSQLIGVWMYNSSGSGGYITVYASDLLIKRCKIDWKIDFSYGLSDITLTDNYFDNLSQPSGSCISISSASSPVNFIVTNNIFKKTVILKSGSTVATLDKCNNNVFDCPPVSGKPSIQFNAAECRNNIIKSTGVLIQVNGSNVNFTNNTSASSSDLLGTDPTNVHASNISTMFAASGTSDGKYMLNPSSPDNIPGYDGTERGAFGGAALNSRYTLSGLANIPVIYTITSSGSTSTNLQVDIKARTIN